MDAILMLPLQEPYRVNLLRRLPTKSPDVAQLRRAIATTVQHAREHARKDHFIDACRAEQVGRTLDWMLDEMDHAWDGEMLNLVAAAVDYFADENDMEDDYAGVRGFDDDAAVADAVRRVLLAKGI